MLTRNKCCPNYGFDGSLQQSCLCQQSEPSGGWLLTTEWGFHQECHHHGVLVRPRPPQSGLCVLTVRVIDVKYKLVLSFFSLSFLKLSSHIKMKHRRAATPSWRHHSCLQIGGWHDLRLLPNVPSSLLLFLLIFISCFISICISVNSFFLKVYLAFVSDYSTLLRSSC